METQARVPRYVEVETSRFCNRQCPWCPTGVLKNRTVQEFMAWDTFETIIASLAKCEYSGWLAFHNYNEPLANPRLVHEIAYARLYLKNARLTVFTNGDYLTHSLYDALESAGLSQMRITVYPGRDPRSTGSLDALKRWLEKRPFLRNLAWKEVIAPQGPALEVAAALSILLISPDVTKYYDRGGTVPSLSIAHRSVPCLLTSRSLSIDYGGNVKMCCNVVADVAGHRQYILGNARECDVIELWNGDEFERLREHHQRSDWSLSPICAGCRQESKE